MYVTLYYVYIEDTLYYRPMCKLSMHRLVDACKQRDLCWRDIVQKVFVCAYYDAKDNVKHVKVCRINTGRRCVGLLCVGLLCVETIVIPW